MAEWATLRKMEMFDEEAGGDELEGTHVGHKQVQH